MRLSRTPAGESGALLLGSVVNGLAAYAFIALGARGLGAARFAPVAIVWVFWAFSAALLTFPIQHWVIRQMELDGHAGGVRAALGRVAGVVAAVTAGEGIAAALWQDRLFGEANWAWPAVVMGVAAGSGFLGVVRGLLAGFGRYHAAAVVIGGENLIRLAAGGAFLAAGGGALLLAVALVAGPLVVLPWLGVWRVPGPATARPSTGLVGAAGASVLLAQVALNVGPPLLSAVGGSETEVTALFAALALFRAPYLVALGLTVRATAPLTRLVTEGGRGTLRDPALAAAGGSLLAAGVAFAIMWPVGPPLLRVLFGPGTDLPGLPTGAVAAGCVLALGSLALTVMLIAAAARLALTLSWVVAVAVGVAVVAVGGGLGPVGRVVVAFNAAELAAVAGGAWALARSKSAD